MSWLAILVVLVGLWLAFKAVGFILRILVWVVVIAAIYWLVAPHLGLPLPG